MLHKNLLHHDHNQLCYIKPVRTTLPMGLIVIMYLVEQNTIIKYDDVADAIYKVLRACMNCLVANHGLTKCIN
jgi:hypothetical protein